MSRWLKSVNNVLEKLDDQVQTADAAAFTRRIGQRIITGQAGSSDDEEYESYDDDESYEEDVDEQEGLGEEEIRAEEQGIQEDTPPEPAEISVDEVAVDSKDTSAEHITEEMKQTKDSVKVSADIASAPLADAPSAAEESSVQNIQQSSLEPIEKKKKSFPRPPPSSSSQPNSPPSSVSSLPRSTPTQWKQATPQPPRSNTSHSSATKTEKLRQQKYKQQEKQLQELQKELQTAREELKAQHVELQSAAERMEHDRELHQEELADMLEEQEEELQQLQAGFEQQMQEQTALHKQEMKELRDRLQKEEHKRLQEGGDWTKELEDTLERERNLMQELSDYKSKTTQLEGQVSKLTTQQEALQKKVAALSSTAKEATERERTAEEKLDAAVQQHKRQLLQRQDRETELERTIAELSAALTRAQQSQKTLAAATSAAGGESTGEGSDFKSKYQAAAEDLETTKTQLALANQQCATLQNELQEISNERAAEASAARERQREYDQRTMDLNSQVLRLEAMARENERDKASSDEHAAPDAASNPRVQKLTRELEQTRRQLSSTSEQLLRQKGLANSAKTEIVTLKGRLESASLRAEAAENALASNSTLGNQSRLYEASGGAAYGTPSRRRRRGGRYSQLPSRTLLSTFGMQISHGSVAEQIATTIDAMDTWMLETGNIMRHEPLARLGFALYLVMVHLWCFGLVFFHAVQSEHADLGNIGHRAAGVKP